MILIFCCPVKLFPSSLPILTIISFLLSFYHFSFPWSFTHSPPGSFLSPHYFSTFSFFLFLSLCPISFTQAVPCFVNHLETQAASNSNIFQQQVLAKALAATRSGPQTELCYWVNKGQLESWRWTSEPPTEGAKGVGNYILVFWNATDWKSEYIIHLIHTFYGT